MDPLTDRCPTQRAYTDPDNSQPIPPSRRMNRSSFQTPLRQSNPRVSLNLANVWIEDAEGNSVCLVSRLEPQDAASVASLLCEAVNRDAIHQAQLAESHHLLRSVMEATAYGLRITEVPDAY